MEKAGLKPGDDDEDEDDEDASPESPNEDDGECMRFCDSSD
jgi:hypothetical protein